MDSALPMIWMMNRRALRSALIGGLVCLLLGVIFWFRNKSDQNNSELRFINLPEFKGAGPGQSVSFSQWKEPFLVVHFWASWCPPCREEFPSVIKASSLLPASVKLVIISVDEDPKLGLQFLQTFPGSEKLESLWDGQRELSLSWGTNKLPETYILGPDRKLIRKIAGPMDWTNPANLQFIQDLGLRK